jgi:hypothetical protein
VQFLVFEQRGLFDESFRIAGDYELLLRVPAYVPDLILSGMRQGGLSSDPANSLVTMREIRRAQKMHGQCLRGWVWMSAMARAYMHLMLWRLLDELITRRAIDICRRMMGLPSYWTKT